MEENNKFSLLFKYGLRESKILDEIDYYRQIGFVESRTEALRRALHCFRYLAMTDENELVSTLYRYLIESKYSLDPDLEKARSLSLAAYAAIIAKRGVLAAEPFGTISANLDIAKNMKLGSQESTPLIDELITSIRTVFLKQAEPPASEKIIEIPKEIQPTTIKVSSNEDEKFHKLWPVTSTGVNAIQVNSKGSGILLFRRK